MWAALLIAGCEVDTLWITGGGEVTVSLAGEGVDDAFVVPGLSEEELDDQFADGNNPGDVLIRLDLLRFDPGVDASWHGTFDDGQFFVEFVDNDVVGVAPCGTSIRHAEFLLFLDPSIPGRLQFDGRGPHDASDMGATPPASLVETAGASFVSLEPELGGLEGTHEVPVTVRCESGSVSAKLSIHWEFDGDIQRRASWRGWKSSGSSGPIGPVEL